MARPTQYRAEYAEQAFKLCLLGATDVQLGDFFGVSEKTINVWKHKHPKFLKALRDGKTVADAEVAHSLYKRALGFSHAEESIFNDNGSPRIVETTKHYPPDATSMIYWLKNRRSGEWRDKQEVEHSGDLTVEVVQFAGSDSK